MVEAEVGELVLNSGPNRQPVKLPKERLNMVALPALQLVVVDARYSSCVSSSARVVRTKKLKSPSR